MNNILLPAVNSQIVSFRLGLIERCDLQSQLDGVGAHSRVKGLYINQLNVVCILLYVCCRCGDRMIYAYVCEA